MSFDADAELAVHLDRLELTGGLVDSVIRHEIATRAPYLHVEVTCLDMSSVSALGFQARVDREGRVFPPSSDMDTGAREIVIRPPGPMYIHGANIHAAPGIVWIDSVSNRDGVVASGFEGMGFDAAVLEDMPDPVASSVDWGLISDMHPLEIRARSIRGEIETLSGMLWVRGTMKMLCRNVVTANELVAVLALLGVHWDSTKADWAGKDGRLRIAVAWAGPKGLSVRDLASIISAGEFIEILNWLSKIDVPEDVREELPSDRRGERRIVPMHGVNGPGDRGVIYALRKVAPGAGWSVCQNPCTTCGGYGRVESWAGQEVTMEDVARGREPPLLPCSTCAGTGTQPVVFTDDQPEQR